MQTQAESPSLYDSEGNRQHHLLAGVGITQALLVQARLYSDRQTAPAVQQHEGYGALFSAQEPLLTTVNGLLNVPLHHVTLHHSRTATGQAPCRR